MGGARARCRPISATLRPAANRRSPGNGAPANRERRLRGAPPPPPRPPDRLRRGEAWKSRVRAPIRAGHSWPSRPAPPRLSEAAPAAGQSGARRRPARAPVRRVRNRAASGQPAGPLLRSGRRWLKGGGGKAVRGRFRRPRPRSGKGRGVASPPPSSGEGRDCARQHRRAPAGRAGRRLPRAPGMPRGRGGRRERAVSRKWSPPGVAAAGFPAASRVGVRGWGGAGGDNLGWGVCPGRQQSSGDGALGQSRH